MIGIGGQDGGNGGQHRENKQLILVCHLEQRNISFFKTLN
jgi:hypothetical protein